MPGIVVGIDNSEHSRHALEGAMHEAAIRHADLTVLTVNRVRAEPRSAPYARHAASAAAALTWNIRTPWNFRVPGARFSST